MSFTDPDTQDFFEAWLASKTDPQSFLELRVEAYDAGWQAAMRSAERKHNEEILAEERRQEERWNRFQPQYP